MMPTTRCNADTYGIDFGFKGDVLPIRLRFRVKAVDVKVRVSTVSSFPSRIF